MALHPSWTEIEPAKARELWKTHAIFAYDENHEVDWQLNIDSKSCMCKIEDAIKEGAIIFVENINGN